jgi:hypothetical protein
MKKMPKPNEGMKAEAQKGIDWREELGRGGTRIGAVRARQIVNGENIYLMKQLKECIVFLADMKLIKKLKALTSGEEGYPSNG